MSHSSRATAVLKEVMASPICAIREMSGAAEDLVNALESVADAVPKSSDVHSNLFIDNLDNLFQLNQMLANNYANWEDNMDEKVCI